MADEERILLAHGSGGRLTEELINNLFLKYLDNEILARTDDSAVFRNTGDSRKLALSTDSFIVKPLFFQGGDIGKLSVTGTVNDLAMSGARARYLSLSLIIEEGFLRSDLERIISSIAETARQAEVKVITGDTKIVPRGEADGLFINTTGVGTVTPGIDISGSRARPGDLILINGPPGEHGIAIISEREGLDFSTAVHSDCRLLNGLVVDILDVSRSVHVLRDPTRGGLATSLNEIAEASGVAVQIEERSVPVNRAVQGACDLLGFDPYYLANEGKVIVIAPPADAERILAVMEDNPAAAKPAVIGRVTDDRPGEVTIKTQPGGIRIINSLEGEILPRIC